MKYASSILSQDERILMLESRDNDGALPHSHEFVELVYVVSGRGLHFIGGKSSILSAGDLFIIHTADAHSLQPLSDKPEPFHWINCLFLPEFCPFDFSVFPLDNKYVGTQGFEMLYLFQSMLQEYREKKDGYLDILRGYVTIVLHKLARLLQENPTDEAYSRRKKRTNLKKAVEYINREYESPIGLDDIAAHLEASPSYVGKLFKGETGMSPIAYVNRRRIEKSCELLTGTSLPIHQIAVQSGFKDLKFYYVSFKRLLGMTPNVYRSKYKS